MDSQVRNFRDFLQLYNKLTEMCFRNCVDNLFNRDLSPEETTCTDRCVIKFSNVNQRIMSTYIRDQSAINERRMKEVETQMQQAAAKEAEANAIANGTANIPASEPAPETTTATSIEPAQPVAT